MLPDSFIEEYRNLYKNHYNIDISKERAQQEGLALGNLLYILLANNSIEDAPSLDDQNRSG